MEEDVNEEQDEFDNDNDFDESTMDPLLIEDDDEGPCSPSEFLIFPDHHQETNFKQEQINYIMENDEDLPLPR